MWEKRDNADYRSCSRPENPLSDNRSVRPKNSQIRLRLSHLREKICLIDSGVAGSEKIILDYLKATGRSPQEISRLILTHAHPDHIGAAAAIKRISGCTVAAHAAEKAWIEDVDLQAKERPVPGFRSLVGGSVQVDQTLQDGDVLHLESGLTLRVLHTPGHSPGSISLWLAEDGALFSGRCRSHCRRYAHLSGYPGIRPLHSEACLHSGNQAPLGGLG